MDKKVQLMFSVQALAFAGFGIALASLLQVDVVRVGIYLVAVLALLVIALAVCYPLVQLAGVPREARLSNRTQILGIAIIAVTYSTGAVVTLVVRILNGWI